MSEGLASLREHHQGITCSWRTYSELQRT
ncbi:hypothetical protein L195_g064381, partial [Trifolium pratense]